jgi:hypothetical protein
MDDEQKTNKEVKKNESSLRNGRLMFMGGDEVRKTRYLRWWWWWSRQRQVH